MGEKHDQPFQLSFNASLKVDFQGSRVTSDGGLILVRELDERLGFGELIARHLTDSRQGRNTQLPLADLLRQSVYSRLAGSGDVNDAERLAQDPTFRLIVSEKIWARKNTRTLKNERGMFLVDILALDASGAYVVVELNMHRASSPLDVGPWPVDDAVIGGSVPRSRRRKPSYS